MITLAPGIEVRESDLEWRFVRAAGPGGQNVNKVATAVELRFDVAAADYLGEGLRSRLVRLAGRRMDAEGRLCIDARRHRTQERNRRDALERLGELIARAAEVPKPRLATRPTRASVTRRLEAKRRTGTRKADRRPPGED